MRTNSKTIEVSSQIKHMENILEIITTSVDSRQADSHATSSIFEMSKKNMNGDCKPDKGTTLVSTFGGPLTMDELCKLSLLCVNSTSKNKSSLLSAKKKDKLGMESTDKQYIDWSMVDSDYLMTLCPYLIEHIESASRVDLISEAIRLLDGDSDTSSPSSTIKMWLDPSQNGFQRVSTLKSGLEASCVLISIMNTPQIDRRLIIEDGIIACVDLLRQHVGKSVVMSISNTGHLWFNRNQSSVGKPQRDRKRKRSDIAQREFPQDKKVDKKQNVKNSQSLVEPLKQIYKVILSTLGTLHFFIERMENLIQNVQLDDQPILSIASTCLATFAIDPQKASNISKVYTIQISTLSLVFSIFQRYQKHRAIILEDLFPLMLKIPRTKKMMRTFPVRSSMVNHPMYTSKVVDPRYLENSNIQPIAALILSLIQGCVTMPIHQEKEQEGNNIRNLSNGLSDCTQVCNFFTVQLLRRCSRKGEEGGASEFRPILSNLIGDLLYLYLLPEFPAADMLLSAISRQISHDLLKCVKTGPNSLEQTYIATALDALGRICAGSAGCLLVQKKFPLTFKDEIDTSIAEQSSAHNKNSCFCGRVNLVQSFMLDCDRCHKWFHGSCVDVRKDNLPNLWICDDCKLQVLLIEQQQKFIELFNRGKRNKKSITSNEAGNIFPLQHLLLDHFGSSHDEKISYQMLKAREFYLAKWIDGNVKASAVDTTKKTMDSKARAEFLTKHFLERWEFYHQTPGEITLAGSSKLMLSLAVETYDITTSFPHLLGVLVKLMEDKVVHLRKLSVKAISKVIAVDPDIMMQVSVKNAVARCFSDESISVREAAITLVGSFVLQVPKVVETFHFSILARLSDKGVSVKKRAVRIFREVLLTFPNYRGLVSACAKMLQLAANVKEDESVRDLIHETFIELWFSEKAVLGNCRSISRSKRKNKVPENLSNKNEEMLMDAARVSPCGNIPTPSQHVKRENEASYVEGSYRSKLKKSSKQIIDVVAASGGTDFLVVLVKDLLLSVDNEKKGQSKENNDRTKSASAHCQELVDATMEILLDYEENRYGQNDDGQMLVAIISSLGSFCEASPALLMKHLDVLLPYLKADNGLSREKESLVVHSICKIISLVAPLLKKIDMKRLENGETRIDIEKITYKFGSATLDSAVAALATLANCSSFGEKSAAKKSIMKIGRTFYSYLFKIKDENEDLSKLKLHFRNNAHRSLSVLGSICRYLHLPLTIESGIYNEKTTSVDPTNCSFIHPSNLNESNLFNTSFACMSYYLDKRDTATKCCSLRALKGAFIARPRVILFAEQKGMIKALMADKSPCKLQFEALQSWKEILLAEEKRIESGIAKKEMDSQEDITVSKKISGDQDGDSSIAGGVMTQHCVRLFELTLSPDSTVRHATTDLIGNLLRQGLINPMETIPYLLALQGDIRVPEVRLLARNLLIVEGEKRPDMLRQRVCAGVRKAYIFQRSVYPDISCTAVVEEQNNGNRELVCIFGPIFIESIRSSRLQRQGLMKSLLTLFTGERISRIRIESEPSEKIKKNNAKSPNSSTYVPDSSKQHESLSEQLPLLSYAAQILAHLPYSSSGDPLFIIYHISGIVAVEGAELLDQFRKLLFPHNLTNSDEEDIDHSMIDELEKSLDKKSPNWKKTKSILKQKSFEQSRFIHLCTKASVLVLLMRLKQFLKNAYYLTDTRCMEYSPFEKETIRDRTITALEEIPLFDCKTLPPQAMKLNSRSSKFDVYALVEQYVEFRQLMREGNEESKEVSSSTDSDGGSADET